MALKALDLLASIRSELNQIEADVVRSAHDDEDAETVAVLKSRAAEILHHLKEIRAVQRKRQEAISAGTGVDPSRPPASGRSKPAGRALDLSSGAGKQHVDPAPAVGRKRMLDLEPDVSGNPSGFPSQKREKIVVALDMIGYPSPPSTVSAVVKYMFDTDIQASQFASFRKADERAWHKGKRDKPLIGPALNAFDLSARPRTVALSTWPLEKRIMGSLSDRADALRTILAARHHWLQGDALWGSLLFIFARDFRFAPPSGGETEAEAEVICSQAEQALALIEMQDKEERMAAAERASRLDEKSRLFGRPVGFDVIQGGMNE